MIQRCIKAGLAAVLLTAATAAASTTTISYSDIEQGTGGGFGFSVIHLPDDDHGNGNIVLRMVASMTLVYDDMDRTLTVTQFDGDLREENSLNQNLGALAGAITLDTTESNVLYLGTNDDAGGSTATSGASGYFIGGSLSFTATMGSGNGNLSGFVGNFTIEFYRHNYNALANRFDPNAPFALGLWGATPDTFGNDGTGPNTNIGANDFGFDLFTMVPLPGTASLGLLGLGLLGATSRRRH